jgi:hypothetical protein
MPLEVARLVALATIVAVGSPAWAEEPPPPPPDPAVAPLAPVASQPVVGVLDVRTVGLGAAVRDALTKQVSDQLAAAGYMVVVPERMREAMSSTAWNSACLIGPCLADLDRQASVGRVLEIGLVSVGANHDYVVSLIDTARGVLIEQVQRTCSVCTTEEAMAATTAAVVELVTGVKAPVSVHARRSPLLPPAPPHRPWLRRPGYVLLVSSAALGIVGLAVHADYPELGAGVLGSALTVGVAGATAVALSFHF